MANELDLYGPGDLAPYSQPLAPAPTPDFGGTELDLLHESTNNYAGGGQIFGQPLPPGVTLNQVTAAYSQLGAVFVNDFMRLGHNVSHTQKCVKWFMDAMTNPPNKQQPRHNYNLYEHANDYLFIAFANYACDNGFSAKLIKDACWWVSEAGRKLAQRAQTPVGNTPAQGRAPSSDDPTDSLTDAQFEAVVKANDAAKINTYVYLEKLWGQSYQANLKMVDAYFQSLPLHEQRALDVYTTGWIKALNTKEVILGLYKQAIGVHSIPSGGGLAAEIAECERVMRTNRKQWLADDRLQARYRELLRLSGRG